MDRDTKKKLQIINAEAAKGRGKQLLKEVDRHAESRETLERIINNTNDPRAKETAKNLLKNPELYKKDYVINEKEASRREKEVDARVRNAIRRGDIPPPKMNETHEKVLRNLRR